MALESSIAQTPAVKELPNIPIGRILANERWRQTNVGRELSRLVNILYSDGLGTVDFYTSNECAVVYITEAELTTGSAYKRRIEKLVKAKHPRSVVITIRKPACMEQFKQLQEFAVLEQKLSLIPLGEQEELPQLIMSLSSVECKKDSNPFKKKRKLPDPSRLQQVTLLAIIPGVGEKKAEKLLDTFGSIQSVCDASQDRLTQIVGAGGARGIRQFFDLKINCERTDS